MIFRSSYFSQNSKKFSRFLLKLMEYTTNKITVRYCETDQMQFVHHSNYMKYFELARLEWLTALGISYSDMEKKRYFNACSTSKY